MGMSGDLEIAIQEGTTIVRVGTAIFGERIYPDSYYWNELTKYSLREINADLYLLFLILFSIFFYFLSEILYFFAILRN